jgi:uncharacterized membrane protein YdjX (TVP38/TMEM64 family)
VFFAGKVSDNKNILKSEIHMTSSFRKQIQTVLAIETAIITVACLIAYAFWAGVCDKTWQSCVGESTDTAAVNYLFLSIVRPIVFTPVMFLARVAGEAFGTFGGTIMTAVGATLSCLVVFLPAKYLGKRLVNPWLAANLPATWQLIRTQDYKVCFALRMIPIVPFDLVSLLVGVADFRLKTTLLMTFIGVLPEAYLYSRLANGGQPMIYGTISTLAVFGVAILTPLLAMEFIARKRGNSLWHRLKNVYLEIVEEVKTNNDIVKRHQFSNDKTPVILLYGFFASRKSLTILERLLSLQGHQVLTFNLGGMFGVFFTRDIPETAMFIDYKIKRQIERYGFKKVRIVAHSKGGLVALWWLMKLGGHRYCDQVITLGTPYRGTWLTYLALVTPLGFMWRDVWQMRPGSEFLKELHDSDIPDGVEIYSLYSDKDRVSTGRNGMFSPTKECKRVIPVPMHKVSHFEFLSRRDVAERLSEILNSKGYDIAPMQPTELPEDSDSEQQSDTQAS